MKITALFVLSFWVAACGGEPPEIDTHTLALYPPMEGDGGGGGGGGSPPAPAVDTALSILDAGARNYLAAAGLSDATTVGGTMWVNACRVSASQGAVTFNSGVTKHCQWANVYPGWIILETDYQLIENVNDRGFASVSAMNGPSTVSTVQFGSKFNLAIDLSVKAGDATAAEKLQLEYQRLNGYYFSFDGAGNQVYAEVTANGGLFSRSSIDIQARAKLLRIY